MRDRNLLALSRELIAVKSRQRNNSSSNPFKKFFLSTTHSTSSVWLSKTERYFIPLKLTISAFKIFSVTGNINR